MNWHFKKQLNWRLNSAHCSTTRGLINSRMGYQANWCSVLFRLIWSTWNIYGSSVVKWTQSGSDVYNRDITI